MRPRRCCVYPVPKRKISRNHLHLHQKKPCIYCFRDPLEKSVCGRFLYGRGSSKYCKEHAQDAYKYRPLSTRDSAADVRSWRENHPIAATLRKLIYNLNRILRTVTDSDYHLALCSIQIIWCVTVPQVPGHPTFDVSSGTVIFLVDDKLQEALQYARKLQAELCLPRRPEVWPNLYGFPPLMALLPVETQQWFWDLWDGFELEFFYQYEYDNRPIDFVEKQVAYQQKMRKRRILLPEDPDTLAYFDEIHAALNKQAYTHNDCLSRAGSSGMSQ